MKKRLLGKSELAVSELCLGTMHFGNREDKETSYRLLDMYVEAGGTFLDTANMYACWVEGFVGGESETLLGQWLKDRGNRQDMVIASKVGQPMPGIPRSLKPELIIQECDKSLKRLQIEQIDLYYAHMDDYDTPVEAFMEAYAKLVAAGKVRFIGASNFFAWRLQKANMLAELKGWPQFCCIQQRHSYVQPKAGATFWPLKHITEELRNYCLTEEVTPIAYGSLVKGSYSREERPLPSQYDSVESQERIKRVRQIAQESKLTPNQVVLRWMMQSEPSVLPIIGASNAAQMEENVVVVEKSLTADQMATLDSVS